MSRSTRRVRDSTRPKALPLTRIARLALVVTRRLPSPHASGGFDIALPDPPHAQLFPKQWQKKAQLQFSPVQTPRAHRVHACDGIAMPAGDGWPAMS
jgi:hypothetical protein